MSRYLVPAPSTVDLQSHPAAVAWSQLPSLGAEPTAITPLKPQRKASHKSGVYRLHGAGVDGSNVIAKYSPRATLTWERMIYEQILPDLPLSSPRFWGFLDDSDTTRSWLFIEDVGDQTYDATQLASFVRWLGRFHAASAALPAGTALPDGGPGRYLTHLHDAQRRLVDNLDAPHFDPDERRLLRRILTMCQMLADRWDALDACCRGMPRAVVHGDLSHKNLRIRHSNRGVEFFPIDWETAGWGVPAADLGRISGGESSSLIEVYMAELDPRWNCSARDITALVDVGLILRMVAAIDWASRSLPYPPGRKSAKYLRAHEARLLTALERLGWNC